MWPHMATGPTKAKILQECHWNPNLKTWKHPKSIFSVYDSNLRACLVTDFKTLNIGVQKKKNTHLW